MPNNRLNSDRAIDALFRMANFAKHVFKFTNFLAAPARRVKRDVMCTYNTGIGSDQAN